MQIKQIEYKFRRGLKETDILFENFKAKHFKKLSKDDLMELNGILDLPDQDIIYKYIEKNCPKPTDLEQKLLSSSRNSIS